MSITLLYSVAIAYMKSYVVEEYDSRIKGFELIIILLARLNPVILIKIPILIKS